MCNQCITLINHCNDKIHTNLTSDINSQRHLHGVKHMELSRSVLSTCILYSMTNLDNYFASFHLYCIHHLYIVTQCYNGYNGIHNLYIFVLLSNHLPQLIEPI